jgi:hypothetical protein
VSAGTERLHEQLAAIGQALEAFDDQDAVTGAAGALLDDDAASPPAQQVAAGVTLHLAALTTEDGVRVTLQRPPGPLTAQLVDPASGAPLVERALDILLAALERVGDDSGDDSGDDGPPAGAVAALQRLAAVVAAKPVEVRLELSPAILKPRELTLTRADAQRLAAALTSR